MTRWPAPPVPTLPGRGLPVRLHDTATGTSVRSAEGPVARMYVCGITPYDATHLGHASTYVAFDLLNRAWRDAGLEVRYVQNVTDVDDPLLERANATGVDWKVLATEQTDLFAEDMDALDVLPPDDYIGAVEGIPLVVDAVEKLIDLGYAYRVGASEDHPDGDVYFSVNADPTFGAVSHLDEPQMLEIFAERGGDPDRPGKKHPLDCLLWRVARPGEPSWDGRTLGSGRPGWHIECTTIALKHLGMGFDVQGGGADLIFPHHEMGAAEGHLLTGTHPYAKVYAHTGMVGLDGHKMSKSRGNLVFVSRLRADGVPPAAIRLQILAHHYRTDWEWTQESLDDAVARLTRWQTAVRTTLPDGVSVGPSQEDTLAAVRERLADDLDAPGALAAVDAWADAVLAVPGTTAAPADEAAHGLVALTADALLGVRL
ncbi:cysteine--1-D-myo-inosityl 2-amino-2-deoxy-alpha-D-glucopyranoside ligase [Kineosporia sp. A_224]|uniref:cysteine--1-D-myo-inosityl 2-amino-2-deoxy-alpha-D-glucopyranoside ligase n=1 Tax=Kineosporia sp. A_224 TaxID=1962180 RepID=UPI000B4BCC12|nr:cysteine--1-D-myo-inosityl 2-amino-2-deoxy-alpha-D-glucopyranoside ligase [Kineosporia sp. A_224]